MKKHGQDKLHTYYMHLLQEVSFLNIIILNNIVLPDKMSAISFAAQSNFSLKYLHVKITFTTVTKFPK